MLVRSGILFIIAIISYNLLRLGKSKETVDYSALVETEVSHEKVEGKIEHHGDNKLNKEEELFDEKTKREVVEEIREVVKNGIEEALADVDADLSDGEDEDETIYDEGEKEGKYE